MKHHRPSGLARHRFDVDLEISGFHDPLEIESARLLRELEVLPGHVRLAPAILVELLELGEGPGVQSLHEQAHRLADRSVGQGRGRLASLGKCTSGNGQNEPQKWEARSGHTAFDDTSCPRPWAVTRFYIL